MEWEYQLEERQLEREERQADATVEVLQRWQEQQTVRRLRQTNGGEGSSKDEELASVAATRTSASTSTLTFRSASAIADILRSREYRTSRTSTADLHATREAFQTQRQHIHQWFYNYNMRQREGPQTERWYIRLHLLQETNAHIEILHAEIVEREREDSLTTRRLNIVPDMPPQEHLSDFQRQIATAARRQSVEESVRETHRLRGWIRIMRRAAVKLPLEPLTRSVAAWTGEPILQGEAINTSPVLMSQYQIQAGFHLVELFAGACCSILVAHLKAGHKIRKYTSVEKDPVARAVNRQLLAKLHVRYPHLLPLSAIQGFDSRLPELVENIGLSVLSNYTVRHGQIDFIGAGFPCQPLSPAGYGLGVRDDRFSPFFDLMRILTWCQREQGGRPFQYLLENV